MPKKECCRSCGHCFTAQSSIELWCRLRKIKVHSDIAAFAVCHHWTKSAPLLPKLNEGDMSFDKQLDFGRSFASSDY